MLNNGAVIASRYRLMRLIATGGMGQVWEATDLRLDRRVAVKVLKAEFSEDPTFRERFRTEARISAQLNHHGIAGVYDYGETRDPSGGQTAYLVMELVQGEPLNSVLGRIGRLSLPHALDMLEQTGRALEVAHSSGVVHRDVKPGNILVTPTGQVKITDFGIAKAVDASPVTKTGMVMGTAQYIAPEQALGQDATAASDVYSLGVVGYEAASGQRPFTGEGAVTVAMKHVREAPAPLPMDVPPHVRELIEITMAKDPAARYADGGEFADAVAAVRAGHRPPRPGGAAAVDTYTAGSARVLPPGTAMLPTSQREYAGPTTGYVPADSGGSSGSPEKSGMSGGQKTLAWLASGALLAAILVSAWLILRPVDNQKPAPYVTPTVTTEAPVVPAPVETTTTAPTTTTTKPSTTTPTPTTTTTPSETTTTETTTPSDTTTPTTTTEGLIPPLDLPDLPGAFGDEWNNGNDSGHSNRHRATTTTVQGQP